MIIISHNDERSNDIQSKAELLRDGSQMDIHTQLQLWKETLHFRRQSIRDQSTIDVFKDFINLTTFSGESHSQLQSQSKLQITPHDYLFVLGSLTTNQTEEESTDGDDISNSNMPVNTD
ncbi:unnamed protein product, partial [Rotaria sordida]